MGDAFAYARDPALLFQSPDCGFAPPLNYESVLFNGKQPVRYERKKLIQTMNDSFMREGDVIEIMDINWMEGRAVAYCSMEEALNGIPAFALDNFWIKCTPETTQDYIEETLALLRRGHSLLHPFCTCKHRLSNRRCQALGISSVYSEYNRRRQEIPCILTSRPREFSAREVSMELGISDVIRFHCNQTSFLLPILNQVCRIRLEGLNAFFSCKDFVFDPLNNREDLFQVLSHSPLPIAINRNRYTGILHDIREMKAQGLIYEIESESSSTITLFYLHPVWNVAVDEDIQAMWHAINRKDIAQALPREAHFKATPKELEENTKKRGRKRFKQQ